MIILMFGWEFPPYSSGGLGTACHGLTKALAENGEEIIFVVPKGRKSEKSKHLNLVETSSLQLGNMKIKHISSPLLPYMSGTEYEKNCAALWYQSKHASSLEMYGMNLYEEVERYAQKASIIAKFEDFDIIHCHDWMTFRAGIMAKQVSGKPLVAHVHATEFDRTGGYPNQQVYDREKEGMIKADKIIAVSNFTKRRIVEHYGIPPNKITVVHNGVDIDNSARKDDLRSKPFEKTVLFLGRITLQKGPDYFLQAAKKVVKYDPQVRFIMAGDGDMKNSMVEKAAEIGMGDKVLFAGFLKGRDIDRAYQIADVYVMPSVSEPFGITPLEAASNGTSVIISKQSGVSEVFSHCLKVDFWDVEDLAAKMLATLQYAPLRSCMVENSQQEIRNVDWYTAARASINLYREMAQKRYNRHEG